MTVTVSMLNHPSTNPNVERRAYFPHLRMEFTLDRNPVTVDNSDDAMSGFVYVAIKHPSDPAEVVIISMPADALVHFDTDAKDHVEELSEYLKSVGL